MKNEIILTGFGVSHGIAMGPAYLVQIEHPTVPHEEGLSPERVTEELGRLEHAIDRAKKEILALKERSAELPESAAEEMSLLLEAHLAMLSGSRLVRGIWQRIERDAINAEYAAELEMNAVAAQLRQLKDAYIASRSDDVIAVGNRLMRVLMNIPYLSLADVPTGGIVLAAEISPAEIALLDPRKFAGIATVHGGIAGHTAVMARSMGLPAVLGISMALLDGQNHGALVIVDGIDGKLIVNPTPTTQKRYEQKLIQLKRDKKSLEKLAALPAVTTDGTEITLSANLESPRDLDDIHAAGAKGIGLFRSEYMFMNRDTLPDEDEQFEEIVEVVRAMKGMPVTFRTLDIGGDKLAKSIGAHLDVVNPALGLRAIRLSLKEPHLLRTQFRAMLRAGFFGPIRILLPMVTMAAEVEEARKILKECYADLKKSRVPVPEALPPLGCMIEIPAAALSADSLAAVSDFFAIGTNDLIQYTIAIDRGNDQVAELFNPTSPAVLRLMEFAIQSAQRAEIPVSICGEMAADPLYTPLLVGLGIREMSMGFANLPRIKQRIREVSLEAATEHARHVMDQYDPDRIVQIVSDFRI